MTGQTRQLRRRDRAKLAAACLLVPVLVALALASFAWPAARLAPRDLPVGVAGPPAAASALEHVLARHAGAFDVHRYADEAAARAAIRDRDVYGAVVVSPQDVTVLTASAASPLVALQLRESAVSLAGVGQAPGAAAGQPRVVDVVPADPDDPRGSALSAAVLPLVLTGAASAVLIFLLSRPGIRRAAALVGASVLAGLTADAIAQGWLGVVGGNWLPRPGAGAAMVPARPLRPIRVLRIALARDGLRPPLSTPGMGDRLGVKVPWRKRWC